MTFSVLLVLKGVPNLYETGYSVQSTFVTAREVLEDAWNVYALVLAARDMSTVLRDRLIHTYDSDNPCPGLESFSTSGAGIEISDAVDSTVSQLSKLVVDLNDGVDALGSGLEGGNSIVDSVDETLEASRNNEIWGYTIAAPFLVLAFTMIGATVAAHRKAMSQCASCFMNWAVLPLFVLVTLFSTIACIVLLLTATMNSDFCGAGNSTPDDTILNLMINSGKFKASDTSYTMAKYYLYQCTARASEDPLLEYRQIDNDIVSFPVSLLVSLIIPSSPDVTTIPFLKVENKRSHHKLNRFRD